MIKIFLKIGQEFSTTKLFTLPVCKREQFGFEKYYKWFKNKINKIYMIKIFGFLWFISDFFSFQIEFSSI